MKENKRISYYFWIGLLFISCAYIVTKMIDNYGMFFDIVSRLFTATFPFLLGFVLAYIMHPVMLIFEKRLKLKRGLSVLLTYSTIILICSLTLAYLVPMIYHNAFDLVAETPYYLREIESWINEIAITIPWSDMTLLEGLEEKLMGIIPQLTNMLTNSLSSVVDVTVQVVSTVGNTLLAFIISIYILLEKEQFLSVTRRLTVIAFKPKRANTIFEVTSLLHQNIGKYLVGKGINSIFVGVLAIIGLLVIGAEYAVLLGVIFGITNMIPIVGPIFGTIIAVGINVFYSPMLALIILVYLVIVQQVETLLIDPKVVGHQLGLNPFFSLLAVTVGGHFFGVTGMILSVPIMGIIKQYASAAIHYHYTKVMKKEKQQSIPKKSSVKK